MATPVFVEEDSRPVRKQTGPPSALQNLQESLREKPPLDGNVSPRTYPCHALFIYLVNKDGTNAKGPHHHSQPGPAYVPVCFFTVSEQTTSLPHGSC